MDTCVNPNYIQLFLGLFEAYLLTARGIPGYGSGLLIFEQPEEYLDTARVYPNAERAKKTHYLADRLEIKR